jgi:formylmethanofuran dehydrogenase subunit C
LDPKHVFKVPVYTECISPDIFAGKTRDEICGLKVWEGNKKKNLSEVFNINEEAADSAEKVVIQLVGDLRKVRMIGYMMTSGTVLIEGNIGMRLGEGMKGGEILVKGNVDSWVGCMMKEGRIEVSGSAGDYVGASNRGTTEGMTGGTILVHGDAGNEVGCYMKGGQIKVEGNIGEFAGVHMKDGTIIVGGDCKGRPGAEMFDGRIIICGHLPSVLPTFTIDGVRPNVKTDEQKIAGPFYRFIGDIVDEGKGKLFVAKNKNPHLSFYEKFL